MRWPEKTTILLVAALLASVFIAYANHFHNSFHFDDSHAVIDNPYIRDLHNVPVIFTDSRAFSVLPANRSYRPLVTASLAFDYWLGNGLNPAYFQASTFFWFLVQIVLMVALFYKICDLARPDDPANRWIALFAAALYGLHPAMAETVNYVIQRGDIYSTLGVIAGLAIYAWFPEWRKLGFYLIPVVLALLSKPPALIFPIVLFVYVWLLERPKPLQAIVRCLPALIVTAGLGYFVASMTPATYTSGAASAYAYRVSQPLAALRYFGEFFLPLHLNADTDHEPLTTIWQADGLLGVVFVIVLTLAAIWCSRRRQWHPAAFGLWWFLLALVPTAVFPLAEVENDHRMYLPSVGLSLAVCWSIAAWAGRRRVLFAVVSVGVLTACTWGVRQRNEVWRTDESLWYDVTVKSPHNGRGLMNYGLSQMEKGRFVTAMEYYQQALKYVPNYSVLEINLGIATAALNQDAPAEQHFLRSIDLAPDSAESRYFYARWLKEKDRWPEALAQLQQGMNANPDHLPSRYLVMEIYAEQGDWSDLQAAADNTLQQFPTDTTALAYRTQAASSVHPDVSEAKTPEDYLNLSLSYQRIGRFQDGLVAAQAALALRPDYADAYNNIAAAYEGLQMWDPAIEAARQALKIRPDFELARNNLAFAEEQKKKAKGGKN